MSSTAIVFPGDHGLLMLDCSVVLVHGLYADTFGTWLRVEDQATARRFVVSASDVEPLNEDEDELSFLLAGAEDFSVCGASFPMPTNRG